VEHAANAGVDKMVSEAGTVAKLWQQNALRVWQANERLLHGMLTAFKLEVELGQEMMRHRLAAIEDVSADAKPEHAGQNILDRQMREMEHVMSMAQKISEELRQSFSDAAKLLFENAGKEAEAAVKEFADTAGDAVRKARQAAAAEIDAA
jgi:hypothetical protein